MTNSVVENNSGYFARLYTFAPLRIPMRVPDDIRKCVMFLQYKDKDGFHLAGTGLFVGTPIPETSGRLFSHVVTAAHIIRAIRQKSVDRVVYLRLNYRDSGVRSIPTDIDEWYFHHTDDSVDVAVTRTPQEAGDLRTADHLAYQIDLFATASIIEKEGIGVGDEVFIAGLFGYHPGLTQNIPIIRVGNIAAMPEEPVKTDFTDKMGMDGMEAYLIESRSMKGLSGSPVFVHLGVVRPSGNKDTAYQRVGGIFYLLGLVVAHWQQKIADPDAIVIDEISGKTVNVGLAVVAPATKIIEVINHPDLKASREEAEKEFVERMRATSDALT